MDPSCTIGFYAKNQNDFESLCVDVNEVQEVTVGWVGLVEMLHLTFVLYLVWICLVADESLEAEIIIIIIAWLSEPLLEPTLTENTPTSD